MKLVKAVAYEVDEFADIQRAFDGLVIGLVYRPLSKNDIDSLLAQIDHCRENLHTRQTIKPDINERIESRYNRAEVLLTKGLRMLMGEP